jgi:two-component system, OmpR family, response regulator
MMEYRIDRAGDDTGRRVLLVCTKRILREELAQALADAGYAVEAVSSGVGGLLILRETSPPFDWLVSELGMPGLIDGRRIAYEYRFQWPLRPALFFGSGADEMPPPEDEIVRGEPDPGRIVAAVERLRGERIRLLRGMDEVR